MLSRLWKLSVTTGRSPLSSRRQFTKAEHSMTVLYCSEQRFAKGLNVRKFESHHRIGLAMDRGMPSGASHDFTQSIHAFMFLPWKSGKSKTRANSSGKQSHSPVLLQSSETLVVTTVWG